MGSDDAGRTAEERPQRLAAVVDIMSERGDRPPDAAPFEQFYRETWRDAVHWAYGLTGRVGIAEEIAQEAFLATHASYGSLANPPGYLRRTVVNLAREHHRATARRLRRERRASRPGEPGESETTDDMLAMLAALPYEQRVVLVLRYWLDWDEPTIAETLGCARPTVRSHAKRGLDRLRHVLEEAS